MELYKSTSIEDVTFIHHLLVKEILVNFADDAASIVKAIKFFNTAAEADYR